MNFPLLHDKRTIHPRKALCPQCHKRKVLEPHSMAILSGGALFMDRKRLSGGMHDRLDGFASITWHGAHDTGTGVDRETYASVDLARDCRGGQFEIYFCSTACLRAFFNSWVNALETKIRRVRRKKTKAAN